MNIYKWFFGNLIKYKPEETSLKNWMDYLFCAHERDILKYTTKKPFVMPGLLYVAGNVKYQGVGYRNVSVGTVLWVRTDTKIPNNVDVEWLGGQGERDQVYCLTDSEWNYVKLHCERENVWRKAR